MTGDGWRLAVGTLTAVRVRPPSAVDQRTARAAMLVAPLAALPLGVVVAVVGYAGGRLGLPSLVTALVAIGALAAGSRALHLDGLSDTVDGLTASYDAERSLRVMKGGTAGPAGVTALVVVLGTQAAAVAALMGSWRGAVLVGVAVCASRAALPLCCARGIPAARRDGLGVTYTQSVLRTEVLLVWLLAAATLAATGAFIGLPWWRGVLAAALAAAAVALVVRRAVHRFGGVTGDVFGACVELALATLLVTLC